MGYAEHDIVERLDKIIDDNLENKAYTIEDICLELGISRSQLFRLLKEQKGLSISRYIRYRKLLKAKFLLDTTDLKVSEVTYLVGLDSPQTLTKFFTEDFGISPTEYRKTKSPYPQLQENITLPPDASEPISILRHEPFLSKRKVVNFFRRWLWVFLFLTLGAIILKLYLDKKEEADVQIPTDEVSSLVILPFQQGEVGVGTLLMDGVMDQMYSRLASFSHLRVTSRNSAQLYYKTDKSIPDIGRELGVAYVLDGSLNQDAKQLVLSIELVEAAHDKVVWSKQFRGNVDDVNTFTKTVVQSVIEVFNRKLSKQQSNRIVAWESENFEAYQEYLQGKKLLEGRTREKIEASIIRFDKAIQLAPNFADAYANKALAYFLLGSSGYADFQESIKLSEQNALAAIRLDERNAFAYAALANNYRALNKWEQAVTTYQIALQYSPNDAQINYWYSITLRSLGELDEAIKYSTKALASDPLYPTIVAGHIGNLSYAHRFAECQKVIENYELTFRDFFIYHFVVGYYYLNKGDFAKAEAAFKKSKDLNTDDVSVQSHWCFSQARQGRTASTFELLKKLQEKPETYLEFAALYAGLSDKKNTLKYLALSAKYRITPNYLKLNPLFSFLHGEPRFEVILDELGLKNVKIGLNN